MSAAFSWNSRRARWVLVAAHAPIVAISPVFSAFGTPGLMDPLMSPPLALGAFVGLGGIQLHHSFAAARGVFPRFGLLTMLVLVLLVYAPMSTYTWNWVPTQVLLIASAPMVLPRRVALVAVIAPLVGTAATAGFLKAAWPVGSAFTLINGFVYWPIVLALMGGSLYGSARLVRFAAELQQARTELAGLAVGRERLRVSRDLHDLLGHSLSAISLKGDLARRLADSDPAAAAAEVRGIVAVARDAVRDLQLITRHEQSVDLHTETSGALALLRAAGVRTSLHNDLPELPAPVDTVFAWTLREGVTNVLRHSDATTCDIVICRQEGSVWMEIVNDGVHISAGPGTGLSSLGHRAGALAGRVTAGLTDAGTFRLCVEVPEARP